MSHSDNHSLSVLHVVWNLIRGGTEGQCARAARSMAEEGYTVRVAVFRREGYFLDAIEASCGPVHVVDIQRLASLHTLAEIWRLRRFIRKEKFDIVHGWDADAAIFGSQAVRGTAARLITSRRDLGEIYPRWKQVAMRQADRRACAVVVNAEAIRSRVIETGIPETRIPVIPNMVDLDEFDRGAAEINPAAKPLPKGRLIGTVARLDPEKDGLTFIEAAAQVVERIPDAGFVVAGEGPDRSRMEQRAAEKGIHERVAFLGDITGIPPLLSRLSIGVLTPKANEGLSNTILEYMAASLPVVATDCGGNRELVKDGDTGFLVPAGDANRLADRIAYLLNHPETARSFGRTGRKRVEQEFKPELITARFKELYREVCRTGG